jgi:hypothetical protein
MAEGGTVTRSSAETAIRDFVVDRLRALFPSARIIHELNVSGQGSNRIDVAAVTTTAVVGVEIKSERDTLKRLEEQWGAFSRCCHFVLIAAHEKHFAEYRSEGRRDDVPSDIHLNHPIFLGKWNKEKHVWRWPEPVAHRHGGFWRFDPFKDVLRQTKAEDLLLMLWADELRSECARHGLACSSRITRPDMIREMVWNMTGREIATAVCRQLRARTFAEADSPIVEKVTA